MIKPFNELEELLVQADARTRALILSESCETSLESYNPEETMNEMVELLRAIEGIKKIAKSKLLIDKTHRDPITEIKNKIRNSYIFEKQNN